MYKTEVCEYFIYSVLCMHHVQKGNIAELLLLEGFARCVDWSIVHIKSGAEKLRAAEKLAKEKRLRLWKDWQPNTPQVT